MGASTDLDTFELILEQLDEPWDIECEHPLHDDEPWWHGDSGTNWFVSLPCGVAGFRCDMWVQSVRSVGNCRCACAPGYSAAHLWADLVVTQP